MQQCEPPPCYDGVVIVVASPLDAATCALKLPTGVEIMWPIVGDWLLSNVALHTPNVERQLAADVPRADVFMHGRRMQSSHDLTSCLAGHHRPFDVQLLCTQGAIGAVVVSLQKELFPDIVAETSQETHRLMIQIDDEGVSIDKTLRLVRVVNCDLLTLRYLRIRLRFYFDNVGSTALVVLNTTEEVGAAAHRVAAPSTDPCRVFQAPTTTRSARPCV